MNKTPEDQFYTGTRSPSVDWRKRMIRVLIALFIIVIAVIIYKLLIMTAPKSEKRPPLKWVPLVEVQAFEPGRHQVIVKAMGTVMPARAVKLKARVSGQVINVHPEFVDGGFVQLGDLLVQLEEDDYLYALAQRKSDLVNAQYAYDLEQGRQQVAQREWQLLNNGPSEDVNADLALRKPHLAKALADVEAAKAALRKAELDIQRTRINAPFNAIIRSRAVNIGSQVSGQETLAELIGTDFYWVQATLPVDRLDWITIPRNAKQMGPLVRITYSADHVVEGRVVRLLGDLTDLGRMAKIIVEVNDPLARTQSDNKRAPLLIGEYVRLEIQGRQLENVFAVPRTALRDDDTVWLLGDENKLDIRKVKPVWRGTDKVLLRDHLKAGDQLVISDLPAPVAGMELQVEKPVKKKKNIERSNN